MDYGLLADATVVQRAIRMVESHSEVAMNALGWLCPHTAGVEAPPGRLESFPRIPNQAVRPFREVVFFGVEAPVEARPVRSAQDRVSELDDLGIGKVLL